MYLAVTAMHLESGVVQHAKASKVDITTRYNSAKKTVCMTFQATFKHVVADNQTE